MYLYQEIEKWLREKVSKLINIPVEEVDITRPLRTYGLYSDVLSRLINELGEYTNHLYSSTLAYDYSTIEALANYVTEGEKKDEDISRSSHIQQEPIAVIGMGCRFPGGCNTPDEFWDLLRNGENAVTTVPEDRWNLDEYYDENYKASGKMATKYGGFIDGIDEFAASHFGITPIEAQSMDVQQRIALEVTWQALENAAELGSDLSGSKTGVFLGVSLNDYVRNCLLEVDKINFYNVTGSYNCMVPNRISYFFNLHGPSIAVDTACSSSLVGVHYACQSLRNKECNMAIAGGVSAIVSPEMSIAFSQGKLMSPDGTCKTFDASANGYVRSEGCGIVILKRLDDAIRDKNNILCVLKGSSVNQAGRSNGISAPSGLAQQMVISDAIKSAGIHAADVQYVETHGTGTVVGDPIEVGALGSIFGQDRSLDKPLIIGSVKTNIGHTETAAGVASLIKVILSMQNQMIPKHLHFKQINPAISLKDIPAIIPLKEMPWEKEKDTNKKRTAGVSSFGIGGANAHIIVQEYERQEEILNVENYSCLMVSAKSDKVLSGLQDSYMDYLNHTTKTSFSDICYSAHVGRMKYLYRFALVEKDGISAANQLSPKLIYGKAKSYEERKIAFLFTGQGSQYIDMGKSLYEKEPIFKNVLDQCDLILKKHINCSIIETIFESKNPEKLAQTQYTQPALFAAEYALACLWMSWGITPSVLMGHSVGEYVAACIGGVFSLEDALMLISARGKLMGDLPLGGTMAVIATDRLQVEKHINQVKDGLVSVAAVNGPNNTVVSGEMNAVKKVMANFEGEGVLVTQLAVSQAFHSSFITPIVAKFRTVLSTVKFGNPNISIVSNVTGDYISADEICSIDYWGEHLIKPVLFIDGMKKIYDRGVRVYIEIGPNPVLSNMAKRFITDKEVAWLPSIQKGEDNEKTINKSIASLFVLGWDFNSSLYRGKKVVLPGYPLEPKRFGMNKKEPLEEKRQIRDFNPAYGRRIVTPYYEGLYEYCCSFSSSYVQDHYVNGKPMFSGAAMISMVSASLVSRFNTKGYQLFDIFVKSPMVINENETAMIQVYLSLDKNSGGKICTYKVMAGIQGNKKDVNQEITWKEILVGKATLGVDKKKNKFMFNPEKSLGKITDSGKVYDKLEEHGLVYGESFQWIDKLYCDGKEITFTIKQPEGISQLLEGVLHPGLMDACAQALLFYVFDSESNKDIYVFTGYDSFLMDQEKTKEEVCSVRCNVSEAEDGMVLGDFAMLNSKHEIIAQGEGARLLRISNRMDQNISLLHMNWESTSQTMLSNSEGSKTWIIFADQLGVGDKFAQIAEVKGDKCLMVYGSNGYSSDTAESVYTVDVSNREDYVQLVKDAYRESGEVNGIINFWSLDMSQPSEDEIFHPDVQILGYGSVLLSVQALLDMDLSKYPKFWIVTQDTQAVEGMASEIQYLQSGVWGLGKVLSLEHSELWGGLIDLHDTTSVSEQVLYKMVNSVNYCEPMAAIWKGEIFVPKLQQDAFVNASKEIEFDGDSAYLVSGASGGLGVLLLEWLVGHGVKKLVLTSRNISSNFDQELMEKLINSGMEVALFNCDISNYDSVQKMMAQIITKFTSLKGVFHLAGEIKDGAILHQTWEQYKTVLLPKVGGAWNLHRATKDMKLDYFVMYSSVASMLGTSGQVNYASANGIMDSFSSWRAANGYSSTSICWGLWDAQGMQEELSRSGRQMLAQNGIIPMNSTVALSALSKILSSGNPVQGCAALETDIGTNSIQSSQSLSTKDLVLRKENSLDKQEVVENHVKMEPLSSSLQVNHTKEDVICQIQKRVAQAVWIDDPESIDIHENLLELGLDSIVILGLRKSLKTDFEIDVPYKEFLQSRTIKKLAELVIKVLNPMDDKEDLENTGNSIHEGDSNANTDTDTMFPLTDVQYAYWVGRQGNFELSDVSCHIYLEVDISHLNTDKLNDAINKLVKRHEMLHTAFLTNGMQKVLPISPYQLDIKDLRNMDNNASLTILNQSREKMSHYVHDCEKGELFSIKTFLLDSKATRVQISLDLLIADGWSFNILIRDLYGFYSGKDNTLPKLKHTFREYVLEEKKLKNTQSYQKALEYWKSKVPSLSSAPSLPMGKQVKELQKTKFSRHTTVLPKGMWSKLKKSAASKGITPSGILLASFAYVLGKWSKSDKFSIMMTVFNRHPFYEEVNDIVGDFTSLIVLGIEIDKNLTFVENALKIQADFWEGMENREVSGVEVLREMNKYKENKVPETIPVVFTSILPRNTQGKTSESSINAPDGLSTEFVYSISQTPQVALDFQIFEQKGALLYNWDTVDELYEIGVLESMLESFYEVLIGLIHNPEEWNLQEPVKLPAVQRNIHEKMNATDWIKSDKLLQTMFLEQVEKNPNRNAVVSSNTILSYENLAEKAAGICNLLHNSGIVPNDYVAIIMPKGWEQIASVLGVLFAGAAFIPLDISMPMKRIEHILSESGTKIVLTKPDFTSNFTEGITQIYVDREVTGVVTKEDKVSQNPGDIAYVIYTSGSTGTPKGVMIPHEGAVNTILDVNERFNVGSQDAVLALSHLNFDLSIYDIFGLLAAGGCIVIPEEESLKDPAKWNELILEHKVSIWNTVPALMDMFVSYLHGKNESIPKSLRLSLLSGDWIPVPLPKEIRKDNTNIKIISLGGATEASIWSIIYPIEEIKDTWRSIPYGYPMRNQTYYVFDRNLNECPDMVPGELYIGGVGLAAGYLNDVAKTTESFMVHPTMEERLYKTGDWGRYLPDGTIEFLGRQDSQVKIRGHRIELGEIESVLWEHPRVQDAVVVVPQDEKGNQILVGYVMPKEQSDASQSQQVLKAMEEEVSVKKLSQNEVKKIVEFNDSVDVVSLHIMCNVLEEMGAFSNGDDWYTLEDIIETANIKPSFERLISLWLNALVTNGYLDFKEEKYSKSSVFHKQNSDELELVDSPDFQLLVNSLLEMSNEIPDILRGRKEIFEVFFGDENVSFSPEVISSYLPATRYYEEALISVLSSALRTDKPVRILEIGARTGLFSEKLFTYLEEEGILIDYTISDTSIFFINKTKERLSRFENITYELLDLDSELIDGQLEADKFDLIISANALHRSHNLAFAMEHLRALLNKNGAVIAMENTTNSYLQLITAAVIEEGFSSIVDARSKSEGPLLSSKLWEKYFHDFGFNETKVFLENDVLEHIGATLVKATGANELFSINISELSSYLTDRLPDYMVPKKMKLVSCFPLTKNGKINRKKLQEWKEFLSDTSEDSYKEASSSEELEMVGIWESILKRKPIAVNENFFELGGDSLLGVLMISEIRETFDLEISLRDLFAFPTIEKLVVQIKELKKDRKVSQGTLPTIIPDQKNRNQPFPLTEVQQAYWLGRMDAFELGGVSTHSYFEIEKKGLDVQALKDAWNKLIKEHDMMRVIISNQSQIVLESVEPYEIETIDLRSQEAEIVEKRLHVIREEMSHEILELDKWPVFDIKAVIYGDHMTRLLVSFDNSIFDGSSMLALFEEWAQIYENPEREILPLELSFRDYVLATKELEKTPTYEADKNYWQERVKTLPAPPELPTRKRSQQTERNHFSRLETTLSQDTWNKLKEKAQKYSITPSSLLLSAYSSVLGRWSKTSRFSINLTLFNRLNMHPDVNKIIGDFTSMTLLEVSAGANPSFREYAYDIQTQLWNDLSHGTFGGVSVIREYAKVNNISLGHAIMPIVFTSALGLNLDSADGSGITRLGNLVYNITQTPQVWLDHQTYENKGELVLIWDYVSELFPDGMLEDMFHAYIELLNKLALSELYWEENHFIGIPKQQKAIRDQISETSIEYPNQMLHELFSLNVEKYYNEPAVISSAGTLTYGRLHNTVSILAHKLRSLGVLPNTLVAIVMKKGWEQVVGVLGTLYAGAAYMPIDPTTPKERMKYLIENGNVKVVITQPQVKQEQEWPEGICVLTITQEDTKENTSLPIEFIQNPNDLAYVIFTSGSTGVPKGVMIDHLGAVNTILDVNRRFKVTDFDRTLAISNLNFDLSVYDIFGPLAAGGAIVLPDAKDEKDPAHWLELIDRYKVTIWNTVPALMQALVERKKSISLSLRLVLLSGDWIPLALPEMIGKLTNDNIRIISLGGATEASIWSIFYPIEKEKQYVGSIPYGYPLGNQNVFILDNFLQDCPDYVTGHIYIAGIGLAQGYWKDQEKTNKSFVTDKSGKRLYKTGDLGRCLPDGTIEILGREDTQVKIRGYRIELGEIESVLESSPDVEQAVVLVSKDHVRLSLVSFVVSKACDDNELTQYLSQRVPSYMVPTRILFVECMPLTANGKIDRKKLLEMYHELDRGTEKVVTLPQNETQRIVADIVKEIVEIDQIDINENLFDIGANSLHILSIQGKLEQRFLQKLKVTDLFEYTTVAAIANYLSTDQDTNKLAKKINENAETRKKNSNRNRNKRRRNYN